MPHRIDFDIEAKIGDRVRAARKLAGMSQTDLAQKLGPGLTFQQVQKYERGSNRIAASRLVEIAHVTHQPLSFFLPGEDLSGAPALPFADGVILAHAIAKLAPQLRHAIVALIREIVSSSIAWTLASSQRR